jgi:hypothetical protein
VRPSAVASSPVRIASTRVEFAAGQGVAHAYVNRYRPSPLRLSEGVTPGFRWNSYLRD